MKIKTTTLPLPPKDTFGMKDVKGAVHLADLPETGHLPARTTLIMQRHLMTMIEMDITKEEAEVLVNALCSHFNIEVVAL